jgi:hypothetical protein
MEPAIKGGGTFRSQIKIVTPSLRALMLVADEEEIHHDVQVCLTKDPVTLEQVYILAQVG